MKRCDFLRHELELCLRRFGIVSVVAVPEITCKLFRPQRMVTVTVINKTPAWWNSRIYHIDPVKLNQAWKAIRFASDRNLRWMTVRLKKNTEYQIRLSQYEVQARIRSRRFLAGSWR